MQSRAYQSQLWLMVWPQLHPANMVIRAERTSQPLPTG